jgi:hypothetical protein
MSAAFNTTVTLDAKFSMFPAALRSCLEDDYQASLIALAKDAESGTINGLKDRYAVVSSTAQDDPQPHSKAILHDNITTVNAANVALLEHFLASHGQTVIQNLM